MSVASSFRDTPSVTSHDQLKQDLPLSMRHKAVLV